LSDGEYGRISARNQNWGRGRVGIRRDLKGKDLRKRVKRGGKKRPIVLWQKLKKRRGRGHTKEKVYGRNWKEH